MQCIDHSASQDTAIARSRLQLLDVPSEIIINILRNFDARQLVQLRHVCRHLNALVFAPELWKSVSLACSKGWTNKDSVLAIIRANQHNMTALHLSNIRDDVAEEVLGMAHNLSVLRLHKWTTLSDHAFNNLGKSIILPNLKRLELVDHGGYYTAVGISTLYKIGDAMPNLEELHIWCNALIDPMALRHIVDCCPRLKALSLSSAQLLSDEDILYLISAPTQRRQMLPISLSSSRRRFNGPWKKGTTSVYPSKNPVLGCRLRYLNLSHCRQLTDRPLAAFAQYAPRLETLVLHGANEVTDEGIMALGVGCPRLQHIKLFDCRRVSLGIMDQIGFESVLYSPTILHRPCFKVGIGFGYRKTATYIANNEMEYPLTSTAVHVSA